MLHTYSRNGPDDRREEFPVDSVFSSAYSSPFNLRAALRIVSALPKYLLLFYHLPETRTMKLLPKIIFSDGHCA
jgi:hypothetical protein